MEKHKYNSEELIEFLQDAPGAIISLEKIDASLLKHCPKLRVIAKYGVGLDNIDQRACQKFNVQFLYTSGVNKTAVAELTVGLMLSLCRNISRSSLSLKDGTWKKDGGHDLGGKTIGIIGVGNAGKEVVRLLKPFHCVILANDIIDQTDYYEKNKCVKSSRERILRNSDIVTIHAPLTKKTKFLINRRTLGMMKKTAFLINTARGAIVQQLALKESLKQGRIAGAAVDVYQQEPPLDYEFLRLPNLICTPHIGGGSQEAIQAMGLSAINHLKYFFNQKAPR